MGRKAKGAMLWVVLGSLLGFGGCLDINWEHMLRDTMYYVGQEMLLDNDGVFDLWAD